VKLGRQPVALHPWSWAVLKREILVGELVRLACARSLRDHRVAKKRGLRFDVDKAHHAIEFFRYLRHSKGRWAGKVFELEPWQEFILWELFGWYRADGRRRFRESYTEVARKNGKTTFAAGIGLYMLAGDREPGAEVYTAATKKDQAKIMHDEAVRMVKSSPELSAHLETFRDNISSPTTASKYTPLGADSKTEDGLNIHCALIDELHAHPNGDLYQVLDTATAARKSPLIFAITTAGADETSFCFAQREYASSVLGGAITDDTLFALIFAIDEKDDWRDARIWPKANPNLGVTIEIDELADQVKQATQSPRKQNAIRRLRLNEWMRSTTRYLDLAAWDACRGKPMPIELEQLHAGDLCYAGLDLSTNDDVTAFVALFPPAEDAGTWDVVCRFWIPEDGLVERVRTHKVPYDVWEREGWVTVTAGNVIDYRRVREDIEELLKPYRTHEIGFDGWNATETSLELAEAGFEMVKVGASYGSISPALKLIENLVLSRRLRHGGHPVLRWMADNLEVREHDGAVRPVKPGNKMSHKKIDGMVALVLAMSRAMVPMEPEAPESVYERRGIRAV
jgi:phage terminase large subunit-like protein